MSRKRRKSYDVITPSQFMNKHHVFPSSRYLDLKHTKSNIVSVPYNLHERYHVLFTNRNPYECLEYLVETFWGGNIGYIKDFLINYEKRAPE